MVVPEQQFAAVAVVAVYYINPRFPEVRQAEEQALLDVFEVARLDEVLPGLLLPGEGEQLVLDAEFRRQEGVDEGDVVVDAADLEDLLLAQAKAFIPLALLVEVVALLPLLAELAGVPAVLDVAQQFDADLVGVEPAAGHGHGAGVVVGVVDTLPRLQRLLGHDGGVPKTGPPFVEYLGLG